MQPSNLAASAGRHDGYLVFRREGHSAAQAAPIFLCRWRMRRQPMIDAVLEGPKLSVQATEPAIILEDRGALVEQGLPVLRRPACRVMAQQVDDLRFVPRYRLDDLGRRAERASTTRCSPSI